MTTHISVTDLRRHKILRYFDTATQVPHLHTYKSNLKTAHIPKGVSWSLLIWLTFDKDRTLRLSTNLVGRSSRNEYGITNTLSNGPPFNSILLIQPLAEVVVQVE